MGLSDSGPSRPCQKKWGVKIMDFKTLQEIFEARRGSEKLALVKQEDAEDYLRGVEAKEGF